MLAKWLSSLAQYWRGGKVVNHVSSLFVSVIQTIWFSSLQLFDPFVFFGKTCWIVGTGLFFYIIQYNKAVFIHIHLA